MIPYDESKSIEFGLACNDVYAESGAAFDPGMVSVHSSRAAWDYYVGGMSWSSSKKKHINEFRAEYGLPPADPGPQPSHPSPVAGQIRVAGGAFCDDNGPRHFVVAHMGDLVARWMAGGEASCLEDLDAAASAGYHVIRTWWYLGGPHPDNPWSHGGSPHYDALDSLRIPDFVNHGAALCRAVADRGLRVTLESGGFTRIGSPQESQLMSLLRQVANVAGHHTIAWTAPINEPSSTHGTSDDDGDNDPGYLRSMSQILTPTGVLWHLGHAHNEDWNSGDRFCQKNYTPSDQPIGYYHGYRAGRTHDKIRHRFSWMYEDPGRHVRLWVDGEGCGAPTSGPPLRYVSATAFGHEMDSGEALALIVAMQSLRGIGSHMSGNGVQKYQPFTNTVGWQEIPWLVSQLPRDVHQYQHIHHGGQSWAHIRGIAAEGECRPDGVTHDDGRFVRVISGPSGHYRLPVERSFSGVLHNPQSMTSHTVTVGAGGVLDISFTYGRVLVGRFS